MISAQVLAVSGVIVIFSHCEMNRKTEPKSTPRSWLKV